MEVVENKFLSNKNFIRHQRLYDGMQYLFKEDDTDNYFSVVKHQYSYGYKEGLYELAKCKQINGINHLISEPIGYLSVEKVLKIINGEEKMTNTLDQLVKQVETWSVDKNLHNGNSDRQTLKFYEEAGEIAAALSRGQMDALKDGIGDTVVTLIILAQQQGWTLEECLQYAYDEIKNRKGKTINGTFVKDSDL